MTMQQFSESASKALLKATLANVYTYLINAATQQQLVFVADVQEVMFGMKATRFSAANIEAMNSTLSAITERELAEGRLPLTALVIVRNNGNYMPPRAFFREYEEKTGTKLEKEDWIELVHKIYNSYGFLDVDQNQPEQMLAYLQKSYENMQARTSGNYAGK